MPKRIYFVEREFCDSFGLINYPKYIEWINQVKRAFLENCGTPISLFEKNEHDLVTINLNMKCLGACREGDRIEISIVLDKIENNTLYFTYKGHNIVTDSNIFTISTEMYVVNQKAQVLEFPEAIMIKLQEKAQQQPWEMTINE